MIIVLTVILGVIGLAIWMKHSLRSCSIGKIIAMILLPYVGMIGGYVGDCIAAPRIQSPDWFPWLWIVGGIIGLIASVAICIKTTTQTAQENLSQSVVVFNPDGTEKSQRVTFVQGWKSFFHNAFNFGGRANLQLFGWGVLAYVIVNLVLELFRKSIDFISFSNYQLEEFVAEAMSGIWLCAILGLAIPLLTLNVRRLRDTGVKNGLNYILNIIGFILFLVPIIGSIYRIFLVILLCIPTGKLQRKKNNSY